MGNAAITENPWTPRRVTSLRSLWSQGLSASEIVGQLGAGISRSAILGKVYRLGLSGRARKVPQSVAAKPRPASEKTIRIKSEDGRFEPLGEVTSADDLAIPVEQRKALLDLHNTSCRWPVGDPANGSFFFCGADLANLLNNRPYCAHHAGRARAGYGMRVRAPLEFNVNIIKPRSFGNGGR